MSTYRKASLQGFHPYVPGFQPPDGEGWVKLNTNECPFPPSPRVAAAVTAASARLQLYPDPTQRELREAGARALDVSPDQLVFGNGADEVLAMAVRAFVPRGGAAAHLDPSYSLVPPLLAINDVELELHPITADGGLPESFLQSRAPLRFITNPNSPTGAVFAAEFIAEACERASGVVVVDEAYVDFAPDSVLDLLPSFDNMLVVRTMSKSYSLAGLRLGFAVGAPALVEDILAVKDPSNVDRLAMAAGIAALDDREHWQDSVATVVASRQRLTEALRERGWDVPESGANFVFGRPPRPAADVYRELFERRVLVRHFDRPGLADRLRVTIGTWDECEALLRALDSVEALS